MTPADALAALVTAHARSADPEAVAREGAEEICAAFGCESLTVTVDGRVVVQIGPAIETDTVVDAVGVGVAPATTRCAAQVLASLVASAVKRNASAQQRRRTIHDLRGALAVLSGQCEMLETGLHGPSTPAQDRSLRAMRRQIDRLRDLIEDARVAMG